MGPKGSLRLVKRQPELLVAQHEHWQDTYRAHPVLYGTRPSEPGVYAAEVFNADGVQRVLELAAGHGRDTLYFAGQGFTVVATDFSDVAVAQLRRSAQARGVSARVQPIVHDLRQPLPVKTGSIDGAFAHMALCMALSTSEIHAVVAEVGRVLSRVESSSTPFGIPAMRTTAPGRPTVTTSSSAQGSQCTSSAVSW